MADLCAFRWIYGGFNNQIIHNVWRIYAGGYNQLTYISWRIYGHFAEPRLSNPVCQPMSAAGGL